MVADLAAELRAHRSRQASLNLARVRADELVIQTRPGRAQNRRNALRAMTVAADCAGLSPEGTQLVGNQDLRHSCAGLSFAAGVPPTKIMSILRHATSASR